MLSFRDCWNNNVQKNANKLFAVAIPCNPPCACAWSQESLLPLHSSSTTGTNKYLNQQTQFSLSAYVSTNGKHAACFTQERLQQALSKNGLWMYFSKVGTGDLNLLLSHSALCLWIDQWSIWPIGYILLVDHNGFCLRFQQIHSKKWRSQVVSKAFSVHVTVKNMKTYRTIKTIPAIDPKQCGGSGWIM